MEYNVLNFGILIGVVVQPCLNGGQCQKFCFTLPPTEGSGLGKKCGCPFGEKLSGDQQTCIPNMAVKLIIICQLFT